MTTILDRFTIAGIASAGLCAAAVLLSPQAIAGGGYNCMETAAGAAVPAACGAVAQAAAPIVPAAAPIVPAAAPVPLAPPVPVVPVAPPVPVVPIAPPVPVVPVAAPVAPIIPAAAPAAPIVSMGGVGGKGDPVGAPPSTEGVPYAPGPQG